jgi:hypothetical protein
LAKYVFSNGKVHAEEGAYAPVFTKTEQARGSSVLFILRTREAEIDTEEQEVEDVRQERSER